MNECAQAPFVGSVTASLWDHANQQLLLCCEDGYLIYSEPLSEFIASHEFLNNEHNTAPFYSETHGFLLLLFRENQLRLWSVKQKKTKWCHPFSHFEPSQCVWSPDGQSIAVSGSDGQLYLMGAFDKQQQQAAYFNLNNPDDAEMDGTEISHLQRSSDAQTLTFSVGNFLQKSLFVLDIHAWVLKKIYN